MEYVRPSSATSWSRIFCNPDRLLLLSKPLGLGTLGLDDRQWQKGASLTLARTFRRSDSFASRDRAKGDCSACTLLRRPGGGRWLAAERTDGHHQSKLMRRPQFHIRLPRRRFRTLS